MSCLLTLLHKLDEDCKKRRKEQFKSFLEKYDRHFDESEDEVFDFQTFKVVEKKGKSKKKLERSFKKSKSKLNKVRKFGELNSYSMTNEGKKYAKEIKIQLRKQKKNCVVRKEFKENDLNETCDFFTKKLQNGTDNSNYHEKLSESEDLSMCNETLLLDSGETPYFRQLQPYVLADVKLDCLTCERRHLKLNTMEGKNKKPVKDNSNSAYNQHFRHSPTLDAIQKDLSNFSLTDKMATPKTLPKSLASKHADSNLKLPLSNRPNADEHSVIKRADHVKGENANEKCGNKPHSNASKNKKYLPITSLSFPSKVSKKLSNDTDEPSVIRRADHYDGENGNEKGCNEPHSNAFRNKKELQIMSSSSPAKTIKTLSNDIDCTPVTFKKYPKRNIFDSSKAEMLHYLNRSADSDIPSKPSIGASSNKETVNDKCGIEPHTHASKDAARNKKDLPIISSSSSTKESKRFSNHIDCTPVTFRKYPKRNIFDSSPAEILDYLNRVANSEVSDETSSVTSSSEDDVTIPDTSPSTHGTTQLGNDEFLKRIKSLSLGRKNKPEENSNMNVLKKRNISPKKNGSLLKNPYVKIVDFRKVKNPSQLLKSISGEKLNINLSVTNSPIVMTRQHTEFITVKNKTDNKPATNTFEAAASNNKNELLNISPPDLTKVSRAFPSSIVSTPRDTYVKLTSRKILPSNLSETFDDSWKTSDTELSDEMVTEKSFTYDNIPNLDRTLPVAKCFTYSNCGKVKNSDGQQPELSSNVYSRLHKGKNNLQDFSSAVALEKNAMPANNSFSLQKHAAKNSNNGFMSDDKVFTDTDKSNSLRHYIKRSTPVDSGKETSILNSVEKNDFIALSGPVTRSKSYLKLSVAEKLASKVISRSEITKKQPKNGKMSAFKTYKASKIKNVSTGKDVSTPKIVKKCLGDKKMSMPKNCSTPKKIINSTRTGVLATHHMRKDGFSKSYAQRTSPALKELSEMKYRPFTDNFKTFSKYTKSWCQKQKLLEKSQKNSSDSSPSTGCVLRSKNIDSLCNGTDKFLNISCVPPEGFVTPHSKRLKFAPNIPIDCLSI